MEVLFFYFAKVILSSGILLLYYRLFLKDKTFHHYNRFYLLSAMVISLILPLIKVSYFTLEVNSGIYLLVNQLQQFKSSKILHDDFFYFTSAALVFGLVSVFFLSRFIYGLMKIQRLKNNFKKENFQGINFYQTNLDEAPFSFFRNLFWKNSIEIQSDLGRQILKHEMVHIEQKHTWDKIFVETTTSLFWFNPFFYFIKKEINLIHEYLADKKALKNSDTKAFAQMLLAGHFSGRQLPATSPFLSSNLKKRLTMLKKSKTKFSYARRILALPILFVIAFLYLVNAKNKEIMKSNLEIEKLVSEIQKDTIRKNNVAYGADGTIIHEGNPELFLDNDSLKTQSLKEIQEQISIKKKQLEPYQKLMFSKNSEGQKISSELRKKSDELQKLSAKKDFDNPKFKALEKELNVLDEKFNKIFGSAEFIDNQKLLDQNFLELDQMYAKMDAFYNSDDFKNKIKDAENQAKKAESLVNSPKFKKQIVDAQKQAEKAVKRINAAEFQYKIKEAENKVKSPEVQKDLKNAEIIAAEPHKTGSISEVKPDIFIDGKSVTNDEMQKLDPATIESMHVYKKGFQGKKNSEIHIKLKK